jgi:CRISPR/Cas system CSM-associated protein Csm3 (group 7 of RAMP superfamily)
MNNARGGRWQNQPLYEKPFRYLEAPGGVPDREKPVTHEKLQPHLLSGQLKGHLRTRGPVHVSSGTVELSRLVDLPTSMVSNYPLVRAFVRSEGHRIIPGSSLKGAVRSTFEAITLSCIAKGRRDVVARDWQECRRKDWLCPACRLFGAMGYLGKIKFSDAVQQSNRGEVWTVPQMYQPKTRDPDGRKFYMHGKQTTGEQPVEAVPEGELFNFSVRFDNLSEAELGGLLTALGLSPDPREKFSLKLGGFKPACFGSVEFEVEQLLLEAPASNSLNYDASPVERITETASLSGRFTSFILAARQKNRPLVQTDALTELAQILRYTEDRECPPGAY